MSRGANLSDPTQLGAHQASFPYFDMYEGAAVREAGLKELSRPILGVWEQGVGLCVRVFPRSGPHRP